jgi:hypothetical protein
MQIPPLSSIAAYFAVLALFGFIGYSVTQADV